MRMTILDLKVDAANWMNKQKETEIWTDWAQLCIYTSDKAERVKKREKNINQILILKFYSAT